MKLCFIDIETSGLNEYRNGILQISAFIEIDGKKKDAFNRFVQPFDEDEINQEALDTNGFTREQIKTFDDPFAVHKKFTYMLGKYVDKYNKTDKMFFVGYNSHIFDMPFMRSWFRKCGDNYGIGSWFFNPSIDVMLIYAHLLMDERPKMKNFKLHTVCKEMGMKIDESRLHDATYDILLTKDLYNLVR